ncbi:uncharacterized protein MELLADRAFT_91329 [Melampsora larici-populina 98AG31]|uniref:HTH La-type RNA-binding domain-containing protein n=1 Tax=Melampsora larici-populina (strain 98AG31 / pathotype 3-4-7) TaxID=747676 RepID=F4RYN3_MELLP|nr:uncharacterized protein MELLADRAFT_91329 [Melampsora larici-populina 98AG31]EGG02546.1 hypothetical protein MELLADRAFT_91329 [Melampsora larici-populina 98AG31]
MSLQSWADRARGKPASNSVSEPPLASTPPPVDHRVAKGTTTSRSSTTTNTPCFTSTAPSTPASSAQEHHSIARLNQGLECVFILVPDDQTIISQLSLNTHHVDDHDTLGRSLEKSNGHPTLPPLLAHSDPASAKTPLSASVNVWQVRKEEMSKRYHSASHASKKTIKSDAPSVPSSAQPDKHSVLDSLSPTQVAGQLPSLPSIVDTTAWPAPSEENFTSNKMNHSILSPPPAPQEVDDRDLGPRAEPDKKPAHTKKIQWKPIKADITHNAPLPTNHSASMRVQRSHKKDGTQSGSNRSSQSNKHHANGHGSGSKSSRLSGSASNVPTNLERTSKNSLEEFDSSHIHSDSNRHTPHHSTDHGNAHLNLVYPRSLNGSHDYSQGINQVSTNQFCNLNVTSNVIAASTVLPALPNHGSSSADETPSPACSNGPTRKPGFIPRISTTIQPPAMELSAGLADKYIGVPVDFGLTEPLLPTSLRARGQYDLHVNAPQGNVWVNDPLIMSDGTMPVCMTSEDSACSAAMVLDAHSLGKTDSCPRSDPFDNILRGSGDAKLASQTLSSSTELQPANSLIASKPSNPSVVPNALPSTAQDTEDPQPCVDFKAPRFMPDTFDSTQPEKQSGAHHTRRKSWKGTSGSEDGRDAAREPGDRKNSYSRNSPSSARLPKSRDPARSNASRFTSSKYSDTVSNSLPTYSQYSNGTSTHAWKESPPRKQLPGQLSKSGNAARPNFNGSGGKSSGGNRGNAVRSSSNHKSRGYANSERGRGGGPRHAEDSQACYAAPANGHPAPPLSYGSSQYVSHPNSPTSNSTPTMSSCNLASGVMATNYSPSQSNLHSPAHPFYPPVPNTFSGPLSPHGDHACQDASMYYGIHPYYPSSHGSSASMSDAQSSLTSPPPKQAYPVFGNYDRPAPLLAYPYPLDPVQYYVLGQCEYYFSLENLVKDCFLRSHMDNEGWVKIDTISSFNRIKTLSTDQNLIKEVMSLSAYLEVDTERHLVRKKGDWSDWLLPIPPLQPYPSVTEAHPTAFQPSPASDVPVTPSQDLVTSSTDIMSPATTDDSSMQPTLSAENSDRSNSVDHLTRGSSPSEGIADSSLSNLESKDGHRKMMMSALEPLKEELDDPNEEVQELTMSFDPVIIGPSRLASILRLIVPDNRTDPRLAKGQQPGDLAPCDHHSWPLLLCHDSVITTLPHFI